MIKLNLNTTTNEELLIKEYLENNASETLADKINSGTKIEKDGKMLVNKKDLNTFMNYAYKEAQSQAEKGARSAMIDKQTVFGWAIHYFEEDSIEGTLFNEDGTEYKPTPVSRPISNTYATTYTSPAPKPKPQISLFDMLDTTLAAVPETKQDILSQEETVSSDSEEVNISDENDNEELIESTENTCVDEINIPQGLIYIGENRYIDDNGIIYNIPPKQRTNITLNTEQDVQFNALLKILGDKLIAR